MATPDATFSARIGNMQTFCGKIADYKMGDGTQRVWMTFGTTFQPYDIPNLGDQLDRTSINQAYADEYSGSGDDEVRVTMGSHMQISYMAMMERAYRQRHRTPTRAHMLHAGRMLAHEDANGIHAAAVLGYITQVLVAS